MKSHDTENCLHFWWPRPHHSWVCKRVNLSVYIHFLCLFLGYFPFVCLLSSILMCYYILFIFLVLSFSCLLFSKERYKGFDLDWMEYREELQVLHKEETITRVYSMKKSIFNKIKKHMEIPTYKQARKIKTEIKYFIA